MRSAGHVACIGEERKVYTVLVGKPEGKRPLRRPRCRKEDELEWILGTLVGGRCGDWIHLDQNKNWRQALVNVVMNIWVLVPRS
jgi:hypothetical protein